MLINRQDIRNIAFLVIAQGITAVIGVITFLRYATVLTVPELGRLSFVIASTLLFGLLGELGMRYVVMRETAQDTTRLRQFFYHSAVVRILLSASSTVLLIGFIALIQPWQAERDLLLLAAIVAVTTFAADPATWILYGTGRGDLVGILLIIDRVLYLAATLLAAHLFQSAAGILFAELITNIIRGVISWLWVRPMLAQAAAGGWDTQIFKTLIVRGAVQGAAIIAYVTYSRLTVVVVQSGVSEAALGYYSFAFDVITLLLFVPVALLTALFPTIARTKPEQMPQLHQQIAGLVLLLLPPLAIGLFLFAEQTVTLWVGTRYAPSVLLIRILAVSTLASAFRFMYRQFLLALNRPIPSVVFDVAGVGLLLGLGVPAASAYGGVGVALLYATLEFSLLFALMLVSHRWLGLPHYAFLTLRALSACLLPGLLAYLLTDNFIVRLGAYAAGASLCMVLFRVITPSQIRGAQGAAQRMVQRVFRSASGPA